MDAATGIFTVGGSGLYQVLICQIFISFHIGADQASLNVDMTMKAGQTHQIWISLNGSPLPSTGIRKSTSEKNYQPIKRLLLELRNKNENWAETTEIASLSTILELKQGDRVRVEHLTHDSGSLQHISFCINLKK